jgi:hypothetical protein
MTERDNGKTTATVPRLHYFQNNWPFLLLSLCIFASAAAVLVSYVNRRNECQLLVSHYTKLLDLQQEGVKQAQSARAQIRQYEQELEALLTPAQSHGGAPIPESKIIDVTTAIKEANDRTSKRCDVLAEQANELVGFWNQLHDTCNLQAPTPELRVSGVIITPAYANLRFGTYSEDDIRGAVMLGILDV